MAVSKKVSISVKDLPSMTSDGKYLIRYRIVSEDKNRISAWSPIYKVPAPYLTNPVTAAVSNGSKITYTTQEPHEFAVGDIVSIYHPTESVFELDSATVTKVTTNTFDIASTATITYVSGGRVNLGSKIQNSVSLAGKTATLTWKIPTSIYSKDFDIFMSVSTGSPTQTWGAYTYSGTVSNTTTYSTIIPEANNGVKFLVQSATDPSTIIDRAKVFYSKSAVVV